VIARASTSKANLASALVMHMGGLIRRTCKNERNDVQIETGGVIMHPKKNPLRVHLAWGIFNGGQFLVSLTCNEDGGAQMRMHLA